MPAALRPTGLASRRWRKVMGIAGLLLLAATLLLARLVGLLDTDPAYLFPATGRRAPLSALYFSSDTGMRFGMGEATGHALAARGIDMTGLSSSTLFAVHRTRAELDAIVAGAVRRALAHAAGARIVLIGQSFGADILQTGLAALPADLRAHVAAVVLVVPGETVFFRADPTGLAYRGTPDARGTATVQAITWAPLTCIYGRGETDSLCPQVRVPGARIVAMPGGHFLDHDTAALTRHIVAAVERAASVRE